MALMLLVVESGELVKLDLHLLTWHVRTSSFGVEERLTTHSDGDEGVLGCARRVRPETLLQDHYSESLLCCTPRTDAFVILHHIIAGQRKVSKHVVPHPKLGVILCVAEKPVSSSVCRRKGSYYAPSLSFLSMAFSASSLALRPSRRRFARAR